MLVHQTSAQEVSAPSWQSVTGQTQLTCKACAAQHHKTTSLTAHGRHTWLSKRTAGARLLDDGIGHLHQLRAHGLSLHMQAAHHSARLHAVQLRPPVRRLPQLLAHRPQRPVHASFSVKWESSMSMALSQMHWIQDPAASHALTAWQG